VVWSWAIRDSFQIAHHDFTVMPNGNILAVVWEKKTQAEVLAAGRNPANIGQNFWPDKIVEFAPYGTDSAIVVWEWKAWDHLIQDFDPNAANYGVVEDHPELIDINLVASANGSWMHVNSVDYDPALDQIIFSVRNFNEFMIIDHSTTTAEAAGHTGGKRGRGGDILYRWGNPANYGLGTAADRKLYQQHDAKWIKPGLPRAGQIMVFNNGIGRAPMEYTTVEIIRPPLLPDSSYAIAPNQPFGPSSAEWVYPTNPDTTFYSPTMGGASMQPNGNVLICEADNGKLIEVDTTGTTVWKYVSPLSPNGIIAQGSTGNNGVFKVKRYSPSYAGFTGHTLVAGQPIETNPLPYTCSIYTNTPVADPELAAGNKLTVYPNPAYDAVSITLNAIEDAPWNIELLDLTGRMLHRQTMKVVKGGNQVTLNLGGYPQGCYLIRATTTNQKLQQIIVVQ